jgi:glycosyltransferase involved in cell wall biosynthesis
VPVPENQKRIRVVYIIGSLLVGGTERQLVELIKGLDKSRFAPSVCCMFTRGPLQKEFKEMGVEVKFFNFVGAGGNFINFRSLIHNAQSFLNLVVYLRRLKPVILHSNLKLNNLFGATAAKLVGVPHIIVGYRNLVDETEKYPVLAWWEKRINSLADVIVVNSQAVKQAILQRLNPNIKKIRVIYNGVDVARFKAQNHTQVMIGDLCLPAKEHIIVVVANLIPYKGHEDIIKAVSLVYKKNPNIKCLLIGRDDGFGVYLRDLVRELNLQDVIVFTGALCNIPGILVFTDIQVLASHQEGFSNVILEGMAAGIPQVVTDVGGNGEAVIDGKTGFVIPPKNPDALTEAILKLLEDKELREQMGRLSLIRAKEHFSIDRMVSQTQKIYEELIYSTNQ